MLAAAALAVVGMAIYLFLEVRSAPAQAQVTQVAERSERAAPAQAREPSATGAAAPATRSRPLRVEPTRGERVTTAPAPPPRFDHSASSVPEGGQVDLKLDNLMELANKAYDTQDFDQAIAIAQKVLANDPDNVRMLRIMVSANCIAGDSAIAQQYYVKLPAFDRGQMRTRCDRYGVLFQEPAQ